MSLLDQIGVSTSPGPFYEEDTDDIALPNNLPVRLIAYYLPQFHPIPENDHWWGKGFTEWTNVTKALPRYAGHLQPRLPGAFGFYDLRTVETLRQQAALAKRHGVGGFCFHFYWFLGHRLLETPLNLLLANPGIDMPFCIHWANEPWTRTWDGLEKDVLMQQYHSPSDDLALAHALEPMVRDPRYIRIAGRPVIMLYRPKRLPDAQATFKRWRDYFVSRGLGQPYLVMTQAHAEQDPAAFGMDAAAGFPPQNFPLRLAGQVKLLDRRFRGEVYRYNELAQAAMDFQPDRYKLFHGVCPGWDNEARRPGRGISFLGATPELYGHWLASACRKALQQQDPDERIVFVNAWNEWAEGAYLEPDRHYGYAFLRETARVLASERLCDAPHSLPASLYARQTRRDSFIALPAAVRRFARKLRRTIAHELESLAESIRPR